VHVNALLILGLIYCQDYSRGREKARIYFACNQPLFSASISVDNIDLLLNNIFLAQVGTIIHEFKIALFSGEDCHIPSYSERMIEPFVVKVYARWHNEFLNNIFGSFDNLISREGFIENLARVSWKFFDRVDIEN